MERVQELLDIAPTTASTEGSDNTNINNSNNNSDGSDPRVSINNRSKAALAYCIQLKLRGKHVNQFVA